MKCHNCNLCLDIFNVPIDGYIRLYWFCIICLAIYKLDPTKPKALDKESEEYITVYKYIKEIKKSA